MADPRVVLLGMTGYGNAVLRGLRACPGVVLAGVVTPPRAAGPFPHYPCEPLWKEAASAGIQVSECGELSARGIAEAIGAARPDLVLVGSFPAVIPAAVIRLPGRGIVNFHPSLLPRYRGATPTYWVLLHGETETGVTAHRIEDERLDAGRIVLQRRLQIGEAWDDGRLREETARLVTEMVPEAVARACSSPPEAFAPQDEEDATTYPRRPSRPLELDSQRPAGELVRTVRAASPFPGAVVRVGGRVRRVRRAGLVGVGGAGTRPRAVTEELLVRTPDGVVALELAEAEEP